MIDQELLGDVQDALLEPRNEGGFIDSDLWTIEELIGYANDRQRRFLSETGLVLSVHTLGTIAGVKRYTWGSGWIATRRLAFEGADGRIQSLSPVDAWMLDNGFRDDARQRQTPAVYTDTLLPLNQFEILPPPLDAGRLHGVLAFITTALSNTGVPLQVPDDFAHYIKWGVLADALSKTGPAHDPTRAAYAEDRFEEGIELAKLVMGHV